MTTKQLQRLRAATDKAIETLDPARALYAQEAINWADLRCVEACWVENHLGDSYYTVLIEEAAPDCPRFCEAIAAELNRAGWPGVRVRTEW